MTDALADQRVIRHLTPEEKRLAEWLARAMTVNHDEDIDALIRNIKESEAEALPNVNPTPDALADQRALSAFGQGQACQRKGGYLSDNPHAYESEPWQAWREGYDYEARAAMLERGG
jgi:DNA replication initiation complex subunit (GINS family)